MFDRQFFEAILPEHVRTTAASHPGKVPVLELHLGDRTVLDLCYIVRLADSWVAVAYFCEDDGYNGYDVTFIPYVTIARVNLTMKPREERKIGFRTDQAPILTPHHDEPAGLVHPTTTEPISG
jgi:hypothetical protein